MVVYLLLFSNFAGFIQKTILESVGCIWFNRNDLRDREVTARKYVFFFESVLLLSYRSSFYSQSELSGYGTMSNNQTTTPFPEGTCDNNQYTVMFKKVTLSVFKSCD
jgi:glycerol-3-phosphate O-acyltransferase 3/4